MLNSGTIWAGGKKLDRKCKNGKIWAGGKKLDGKCKNGIFWQVVKNWTENGKIWTCGKKLDGKCKKWKNKYIWALAEKKQEFLDGGGGLRLYRV